MYREQVHDDEPLKTDGYAIVVEYIGMLFANFASMLPVQRVFLLDLETFPKLFAIGI